MTATTDYIINDFDPIDSEATIEEVKDFFIESNFSHFPVAENGIYIGSITAADLDTFEPNKKISDYRYALEGFFARINLIWLDVLEIFATNQTDIVPVLDEENKYVGYYEIYDIIQFLHETPFLKEAGRIIIIEKPTIDFSMGQIVQIAEGNNGSVLGVFISNKTTDLTQIIVKIGTGPINEIIQTFRRYGYSIISEHPEDNFIKNLQERADYLNKYLNT